MTAQTVSWPTCSRRWYAASAMAVDAKSRCASKKSEFGMRCKTRLQTCMKTYAPEAEAGRRAGLQTDLQMPLPKKQDEMASFSWVQTVKGTCRRLALASGAVLKPQRGHDRTSQVTMSGHDGLEHCFMT